MIGIAQAQILELSPSSFSFSAYPGETIERELTIKTSGNFAVYLNSSNNSIILNYTSPLIVEREKTIPIQFIIPGEAEAGNYTIQIMASYEYAEVQVYIQPEQKRDRGGSLVSSFQNRPAQMPQAPVNETPLIKEPEVTKEVIPANNTSSEQPWKKINIKSWGRAIMIMAVILGLIGLFKIIKRMIYITKSGKWKEKRNGINNKQKRKDAEFNFGED